MDAAYPSPAAQAIFLAARELPAETREAWLARECGGDTELRRTVVQLLAA
jgi:hypothetical protein